MWNIDVLILQQKNFNDQIKAVFFTRKNTYLINNFMKFFILESMKFTQWVKISLLKRKFEIQIDNGD